MARRILTLLMAALLCLFLGQGAAATAAGAATADGSSGGRAGAPSGAAPAARAAAPALLDVTVIGDASDCTGAGSCAPLGLLTYNIWVTGTTCEFSGSINWGDGAVEPVAPYRAGFSLYHQYTSPGLFTVMASIQGTPLESGATCTTSFTPLTVEVPSPITVNVSAKATENQQPSPSQRSFTLDATGTTVTPADAALTYDWTVPGVGAGSGSPITAIIPCSATDQTITVDLVVHAVKGTANKAFNGSVPISVRACPTVSAAFTAARQGATFTTTTFAFDASPTTVSPSGATVSYEWAFGDGSSGSGASTAHTYACSSASRTVSVTLTVTARWPELTLTGTATQAVTVDPCTVIVLPVPPKAVEDSVTVPAGSGLVTGNVLSNDDPGKASNGQPFRLRVIARQPRHGTMVMSPAIYPARGAGQFLYRADRGFCGIDSFTYTIRPPAAVTPDLASSNTVYLYVCGDSLPRYLRGLAVQVRAAGTPQAAVLLRDAAALVASGQTSAALVKVTAANDLVGNALLSKGISYAEQRLEG